MNEIINTYTPIFLVAFIAAHTPGPNNIMLLRSCILFGYKKTLPHILGIVLGFSILFIALNIGIISLLTVVPWTLTVIKVIGTIYFLWLAYKTVISDPAALSNQIDNTSITHTSKTTRYQKSPKPFSFLQAVLFQWINVKAILYAISISSMYELSFSTKHFSIVMAIIFVNTLSSTHVWALFGVMLQKIIHHVWLTRTINIILGLALVWFCVNMWV